MAEPDDGDEDFSGDDLDALPAATLDTLEQTAIQLTQRSPARFDSQALQQQLQQTYQTLPTLPSTRAQTGGRQQVAKHTELPSSDYGNFDEEAFHAELIDALDPLATIQETRETVESKFLGEATHREQEHKSRYSNASGAESSRFTGNHDRQGGEVVSYRGGRGGDVQDENGDMMEVDTEAKPVNKYTATIDAFQAQVQELQRERDALQESLEMANSTVLAKAGEILIVRANQAKAIKEYERKMTAMQNLHAGEIAKKKAEIEAALAEKERVATENKFLKKDLTDEGEVIKNLRKNFKNMDPRWVDGIPGYTIGSPITTPKKLRNQSYRDGFDDDEIMMSPSKAQGGRGRAGTPKAGAKRKRRGTEDSPGLPIRMSQPNQPGIVEEEKPQQETEFDTNLLRRFGKEDGRLQFLHMMIGHRPNKEHARTMEAFIEFAFPSAPEKPFSSLICDKLPILAAKIETEAFAVGFCGVLLSLWSQCLDEKFYSPLYLITDLLKFVLTLHTTSTAPHLMDSLVPLAQKTADINAMVQFKRENMSELKSEVSVSECLSLLHMTALGCVREEAEIRRFWRLMRFDFVLMMLNPNQPMEDIRLMLNILSTSVLNNSFGPFVGTIGEEQTTNERHVVSRITGLLLDSPNAEERKEPYDATEIAELNQDVLELLGAMCCTEYGGRILALHPNVIARLVKVMNEELESLYDFQDTHSLRANLINTSTRILHHLLTSFPTRVNLHAKLNTVHGGMQHKYLLAVTRLAFSEGLVLEMGIEDDVVECAYQLLEGIITTPEEGDALTGVFVSQGKRVTGDSG